MLKTDTRVILLIKHACNIINKESKLHHHINFKKL